MKLQNIHYSRGTTFLFLRNSQNDLYVETDTTYNPTHYEPKDVFPTKRYLIDRVAYIEKTKPKVAFIDIEVAAPEMPDPKEAKYPVSCIGVHNPDAYGVTPSFFNKDLKDERKILTEFVEHMRKERYDIWLSWNVDFDYTYLYNRIENFPNLISPIGQRRQGIYPAGLAIVDYLKWFKKIYRGERSYRLIDIARKYAKFYLDDCGVETFKGVKADFSKAGHDVWVKNQLDLEFMHALEGRFQLIPYFDEIRRFAKCEWEDLLWNSRIIDQLILAEAKRQKVILPAKKKYEEEITYEGAYRTAKTGLFLQVFKADIASAYPNIIISFCNNRLLTRVGKELLRIKQELKEKGEKLKYEAIKGIVNSLYGVTGFKGFRLFDINMASLITAKVRELLHYIESEVPNIVYIDTDSIFYQADEDLTKELNALVQMWAGIDTDIRFESEGCFDRILILGKCHYVGYYTDGCKEIKGVEAKRKDSSLFMARFQEELIERILNGESQRKVTQYIEASKTAMKSAPLYEIAFPCKLSRKKAKYKNIPIFVRALENSGLKKGVGDPFYYIYMQGKDEARKNNVKAFDEDTEQTVDRAQIDWDRMLQRNIDNKVKVIFEAMGWL